MVTSYPKKHTTGGVWKVTDVAKNLLEHGTWPGIGSVPGGRGAFGGGQTPTTQNTIDYVAIASTGDAADFGDLISAANLMASVSSFTRGCFCAGAATNSIIKTVTIASTGNAWDFGDLTVARDAATGMSNATRGICAGGGAPPWSPGILNVIDYFTIASLGDATDFGDLTTTKYQIAGGSSPTRGFALAGQTPTAVKTMDMVEMASTGNAIDFGDMTETCSNRQGGQASSSTRLVSAGGSAAPSPNSDRIDLITMASLGDATDFGNITSAKFMVSATSNSTRGIFVGGILYPWSNNTNIIDYVTISTAGDAVDFGDLTLARGGICSVSNSHGGLEAYDPRPRPAGIGRGFFGGGYTAATEHDTIEEILIPTTGNTTDFGNLTFGRSATWGCASSLTRAVLMGGHVANPYLTATIDAFEMTSKGNACDFGDLTAASRGAAMVSSATRGVVGGGADS